MVITGLGRFSDPLRSKDLLFASHDQRISRNPIQSREDRLSLIASQIECFLMPSFRYSLIQEGIHEVYFDIMSL